jgi:hypothetical protein
MTSLYMAVNHNGVDLMLEPVSDYEIAAEECALYSLVTGNAARVVLVAVV